MDCSGRADGFAVSAADALRAIDLFGDCYIHWTRTLARFTVYASVFVQMHLKKAEPIEQRIKSA